MRENWDRIEDRCFDSGRDPVELPFAMLCEMSFSILRQDHRDNCLAGFKDAGENFKAFIELMSWPEDVEAAKNAEQDRTAREAAAQFGHSDIDEMVRNAWVERERAIAEHNARLAAEAQAKT